MLRRLLAILIAAGLPLLALLAILEWGWKFSLGMLAGYGVFMLLYPELLREQTAGEQSRRRGASRGQHRG